MAYIRELGRPVRRADPRGAGSSTDERPAGPNGDAVRFLPTSLAGAFLIEPERHAGRARLLRPHLVRARSSAARARAAARAVQRLLQPPAGHAARPPLPGAALRGGEARALHAGRALRRRRRPAPRLADLPAVGRRWS